MEIRMLLYVTVSLLGVLLILYYFKVVEVNDKSTMIKDLNKRIDNLNSALVEQLKTIDKLVKEIESLKLIEGKEVRYYSLKDTLLLFDTTASGEYLPNVIYPYLNVTYPYSILVDDGTVVILGKSPTRPVQLSTIIKLVDGKEVEVWNIRYDRIDDIAVSSGYTYILTRDNDNYTAIINIWDKDNNLIDVWAKQLRHHPCPGTQPDNYYNDIIYYSIHLSIAVYSNGDVVIAADGINRFSSDGKLLAVYIDPCSNINITDITIDEHDNLYILDSNDDRVYKLDKDGNIIRVWSIHKYSPFYDKKIEAVNDVVYVLDVYGTLNIFDANDGRLINSIQNCCVDFDVYHSMIYAIEDTEHARRIIRYHADNRMNIDVIKEYPPDHRISMRAHDIKVSNDSIFVALQHAAGGTIKIYKYDKEGSKVDEWIIKVDNQFNEVRLAYKDGRLLAALEAENKIIVYDEEGNILNEYVLNNPISTSIIDIDYDGEDVYVTLSDGIAIIDGDDGKIKRRLWLEGDGCTLYGHIRYIPGGGPHLFVSSEEAVLPGTGCKDPDGDGPMELGDAQFRYMGEITVATVDIDEDTHAKRIYALDQRNYRIQLFDENASFIDKINLVRSSVMYGIVGMEVDKQGYIYLADPYALMVFNPKGELVSAMGSMCHPFNVPCYRPAEEDVTITGIDIDDSNGDIYVLYNNLEVTYIARFAPRNNQP